MKINLVCLAYIIYNEIVAERLTEDLVSGLDPVISCLF